MLYQTRVPARIKGTIMCLLGYFNSSDMVFEDVTYTFPIIGLSYLPPDRVFGRIEKTNRKREDILTPNGYHEILKLLEISKYTSRLDYNGLYRVFQIYYKKYCCNETPGFEDLEVQEGFFISTSSQYLSLKFSISKWSEG